MPKNAPASRKPNYEQRLSFLRSQRETLMKEIEFRERSGNSSPIYRKARTFLTHFWARSDWTGRSELVAGARWLIGIGAAQSTLPDVAKAKSRHRVVKKPAGTHARYRSEQRKTRSVQPT